jgi:D-glycero-D-manno-heptose 1,7-bisphosphate phosphatase
LKSHALFLDRDGVINRDHGYVIKSDQFEFIEGIFDLCHQAKRLAYLLIVVTNQAGIGRGYFTEQEFLELTDWMCAVFQARGVPIDKVYFCPFHPEQGIGPYKKNSHFRKPAPGMILEAAREFNVDLSHSVLIGDKETDIGAGLAAGIGCNVLYRPCSKESAGCPDSAATAVVQRLTEAAAFLHLHPSNVISHK